MILFFTPAVPETLAQVHHGNRLSDPCEDGEALCYVHSTALEDPEHLSQLFLLEGGS